MVNENLENKMVKEYLNINFTKKKKIIICNFLKLDI